MRVLVKRAGAFGDVVATTPVIRRLRKELGPDADIHVETQYPQIFVGNPDVTSAFPAAVHNRYDKIIDLNMGYEKFLRRRHAVDSYMEVAFGDTYPGGDKSYFMKVGPPPLDLDWRNVVAVHAAKSWQNRTLSYEWWQRLADMIVEKGYTVLTLGLLNDYPIFGNGVLDTRGRFNPQQQAAAIAASRVLVATDSGVLFGLLPCTDTPAVALLTITRHELAAVHRHGEFSWRWKSIEPDLACIGCSETYDEPLTYHGCKFGHYKCVTMFKHDEVLDAVLEGCEITAGDDGHH